MITLCLDQLSSLLSIGLQHLALKVAMLMGFKDILKFA